MSEHGISADRDTRAEPEGRADAPPAESAETLEFLFFGASWCGPCIQFAPIVDEMVAETRRKTSAVQPAIDVIRRQIDVDDDAAAADDANVSNLPTTVVVLNGEEVLRLVGSRPKRELRAEVANALGERWQDDTSTGEYRHTDPSGS